MLQSPQLPCLYEAITKVSLPNQHWFSGVNNKSNRPHNPYFKFIGWLPRLESLTFTMHNAGLTDSCFGEKQMIDIERVDVLRSRSRKVLGLNKVVENYDIAEIFRCRGLRRVRLEYVECARMRTYTVVGNAAELMRQLQIFLVNGFARHGMNVHVELAKVERD